MSAGQIRLDRVQHARDAWETAREARDLAEGVLVLFACAYLDDLDDPYTLRDLQRARATLAERRAEVARAWQAYTDAMRSPSIVDLDPLPYTSEGEYLTREQAS